MPSRSSSIGDGITLGLLAFTYPGYAFWVTVLLVFYIAVRLWSHKVWRTQRAAGYSLLLRAGGLVFGAYLTLPMWIEHGSTGIRFGINLST